MTEQFVFRPPRQRGILFHSAVTAALGASSVLTFLLGLNQQIGAYFVLFLIVSLLLFAPLPWIFYRTYSLIRAHYSLGRDGLRLRWGMRAEDIPLPDIEWVRRPADLAAAVPLPRLRWPGAVLGTMRTPDLGPVEFIASGPENLVLVATPHRVYAISPEDPDTFIRSFQQSLEMGSITPLSSVSVLPAAYLSKIWSDLPARVLLISGLLLTILLFAGVSLAIPGRATTPMGFYSNGAPLPPVPAAQMLLIPILGAFIFVVDMAAGLFFYRHESDRLIAYIVWGSGVVTSLLLIAAILFINLSR